MLKVTLAFHKLRETTRCKAGMRSVRKGESWEVIQEQEIINVRRVNMLTANARSVLNKTHMLEAPIIDHEPNIAVITETWLDKNIPDSEIAPLG